MLCYVMLCYVMLCYVMLCYVMLTSVLQQASALWPPCCSKQAHYDLPVAASKRIMTSVLQQASALWPLCCSKQVHYDLCVAASKCLMTSVLQQASALWPVPFPHDWTVQFSSVQIVEYYVNCRLKKMAGKRHKRRTYGTMTKTITWIQKRQLKSNQLKALKRVRPSWSIVYAWKYECMCLLSVSIYKRAGKRKQGWPWQCLRVCALNLYMCTCDCVYERISRHIPYIHIHTHTANRCRWRYHILAYTHKYINTYRCRRNMYTHTYIHTYIQCIQM